MSTIRSSFQVGFTLVEMLVYLAIFMAVSTASIGLMISLSDFINQYQIETVLYRSGSNVMEQVMLGLRQADQVDLLNTNLNDPALGRLTLEQGASTTEFVLTGGALNMSVDGVQLGTLLSNNVVVDGFTVFHYPSSRGDLVRVKLQLTATIDSQVKSITLYDGAVVRGSI